jgi:hypothetical protein
MRKGWRNKTGSQATEFIDRIDEKSDNGLQLLNEEKLYYPV